nr:LysR family transcriptional regulator [Pseudoalteromonas sp.]
MSVVSNTQDLEAFISVVDTGGFSSAANALDEQVAKNITGGDSARKILKRYFIQSHHKAH